MGPVESQLRQQLRRGEIISRSGARRAYGAVALVLLNGWEKRGIVEVDGDRIVAKVRVVPEATIEAVNRRLAELPGQPAPDQAAAERRRLQREALRAQLAAAKTLEERALVVQRSQAIADSEARRASVLALADRALPALPGIAAAFDDAELSDVFGIDFDDEVA